MRRGKVPGAQRQTRAKEPGSGQKKEAHPERWTSLAAYGHPEKVERNAPKRARRIPGAPSGGGGDGRGAGENPATTDAAANEAPKASGRRRTRAARKPRGRRPKESGQSPRTAPGQEPAGPNAAQRADREEAARGAKPTAAPKRSKADQSAATEGRSTERARQGLATTRAHGAQSAHKGRAQRATRSGAAGRGEGKEGRRKARTGTARATPDQARTYRRGLGGAQKAVGVWRRRRKKRRLGER